MKKSPILQLLFLLFLGLITGNRLLAQVASPQTFKSQQSYNPATAAIQEDSLIAYIQSDGTGESKTVANYFGYEFDSGEVEKITSERRSLLGVFAGDDWGLEAFMDMNHKEEIENENNSGSPVATAGNKYTIESTLRYVLFGISYSPDLKFGVNVAQKEETVTAFKITNTDLTVGLGLSYQLIENLFFGVGGNLVSSEATGKTANRWLEYYYGVGFGIEPDNKLSLRFEAHSINSPEDGEEASGSKAANNHRATDEVFISAELIYQQIKGTYQTRTHTVNPMSTRSSEGKDTTATTTMGVGYTLDDPSVFIEALQHEAERTRGDYTTTKYKSLELSVGFLF